MLSLSIYWSNMRGLRLVGRRRKHLRRKIWRSIYEQNPTSLDPEASNKSSTRRRTPTSTAIQDENCSYNFRLVRLKVLELDCAAGSLV